METAFSLLGLEPSVSLDAAEVEAAWQGLAKDAHPDQGGNAILYQSLNEARTTLKDPLLRLREILRIRGSDGQKRGGLGDEVANLFGPVAGTIEKAGKTVKLLEAANTALKKALLQKQVIETQQGLSARQAELGELEDAILSSISDGNDTSRLERAARDLAFIRKWQAEMQKLFASLWV